MNHNVSTNHLPVPPFEQQREIRACLERIRLLCLRFLLSELNALIAHMEKVGESDGRSDAVLDSIDRALSAADSLKRNCQNGNVPAALTAALGLAAAMHGSSRQAWASAIARGCKVRESAAAGGRARVAEAAAQYDEYCREVAATRHKHPKMPKRSLYAAVAKKFGVSPSTIRYHVEKSR